MISENRLQEMEDLFWSETNDPETEEWRDDLTPEEADIVAEWDERTANGMARLIGDILREEA